MVPQLRFLVFLLLLATGCKPTSLHHYNKSIEPITISLEVLDENGERFEPVLLVTRTYDCEGNVFWETTDFTSVRLEGHGKSKVKIFAIPATGSDRKPWIGYISDTATTKICVTLEKNRYEKHDESVNAIKQIVRDLEASADDVALEECLDYCIWHFKEQRGEIIKLLSWDRVADAVDNATAPEIITKALVLLDSVANADLLSRVLPKALQKGDYMNKMKALELSRKYKMISVSPILWHLIRTDFNLDVIEESSKVLGYFSIIRCAGYQGERHDSKGTRGER